MSTAEPSRPDTEGSLRPDQRSEIEARLRRFFSSVARQRGILTVYLYGSVARGTARQGSDVDLAVLFAEDPPRTVAGLPVDLEDDLQELLGLPVQVVALNRADPDLVHQVLVDSCLILDLDPARRTEFEVRLRNAYFDLQPILERYRRPEKAP